MPIIAVPTSVGYGASFGGVAALLAMLNSCAAGITVVNIDNGFGAACAATRILRLGAAALDRWPATLAGRPERRAAAAAAVTSDRNARSRATASPALVLLAAALIVLIRHAEHSRGVRGARCYRSDAPGRWRS
jgi:hypothetical protein